jgi:hypothetical protein
MSRTVDVASIATDQKRVLINGTCAIDIQYKDAYIIRRGICDYTGEMHA